MDRRRIRTTGLVVAAIAVLALLAVFGLGSTHSSAKAPELPSEPLVGQGVSLANLLGSAHGRPSLVLFWASWCGPCKQEAPAIERFSQTSLGRGRIVGVNWSDARSSAQSFVRRYRWSFPNQRDGDGTVGNDYRLTGLPTTFVVSSNGRITATLRGPQSEAALKGAMEAAEGH